MSPCEVTRRWLPQYVADGEPPLACYRSLRAHIHGCADCQAYLATLLSVESGLRAYPKVATPATLRMSVMQELERESRSVLEEWQPLPWSVWLPLLTLTGAVLLVLFVSPGSAQGAMASGEPAQAAREWLMSLRALVDGPLFWAVWSGVFAAIAGLGLVLSLISMDGQAGEQLAGWEDRVSSAASRLWEGAHHQR